MLLILAIVAGLVVLQTVSLAAASRPEAQQAIDDATRAIINGQNQGKDVSVSKQFLNRAIEAYSNENYDIAVAYAGEAMKDIGTNPIEITTGSQTIKPIFIGTGVLIIISFAAVYLFRKHGIHKLRHRRA